MTIVMKESRPQVYLQCDACNYGKNYEWIMDKGDYYNGGFCLKQCPKCHFIDEKNSLKIKQEVTLHRKGIFVKAVDY